MSSTSAAAAGAAAVAAGEDDVLHGGAADARRALLAEHPHDGVGDVALAAAVGPDHHGDAGFEDQLGLPRERLEALHAQRAQIHPRLHPAVCWEDAPGRGPAQRRRRAPQAAVAGAQSGRGRSSASSTAVERALVGDGGRRLARRARRPARRARPRSDPAPLLRRPRSRMRRRFGLSALLSSRSASAAASCSARFLLAPTPRPDRQPVDHRFEHELARMRRADRLDQPVGDRAARLGELFLKLGLEVDVAALGVRDVLGEGFDHGGSHDVEAVGEVDRRR